MCLKNLEFTALIAQSDDNSSFKLADKADDIQNMANQSTFFDPLLYEDPLDLFDTPTPEQLEAIEVPARKVPEGKNYFVDDYEKSQGNTSKTEPKNDDIQIQEANPSRRLN